MSRESESSGKGWLCRSSGHNYASCLLYIPHSPLPILLNCLPSSPSLFLPFPLSSFSSSFACTSSTGRSLSVDGLFNVIKILYLSSFVKEKYSSALPKRGSNLLTCKNAGPPSSGFAPFLHRLDNFLFIYSISGYSWQTTFLAFQLTPPF